jgi:2-oxoisovalerate dehydrogenase E1 component beta subunit
MEMSRDASVVSISRAGEDSRRVTNGLANVFGAERVLEIAPGHGSVLAAGAGAALEGLRPVCEVDPSEVVPRDLSDLLDVASQVGEWDAAALPLVLRIPTGGHAPGGPMMPPSLESWLLGTPTLKVVAPASPADAKGLMVSAIREPVPVCVLEQEQLFGDIDDVPEGGHLVPIGEARVIHEGDRLTVISHGAAVPLATRAAERLDDGVEVIDLRTLQPLDRRGILESIRRTGRAVIVESPACRSLGADITSIVLEGAFEYLDGPLRRVVVSAVDGGDEALARIEEACGELLRY